jgi:hypothetical protein
VTTAWHDLQHEPITWESFLAIDEDARRELEIADGYVVRREQRSSERLARMVLLPAFLLTRGVSG